MNDAQFASHANQEVSSTSAVGIQMKPKVKNNFAIFIYINLPVAFVHI